MFPVSALAFNLMELVQSCYMKMSSTFFHVITRECDMKKKKIVNEFMYYYI